MSRAIRTIAILLVTAIMLMCSLRFVSAESRDCAFALDSCAEAMAMVELDSGRVLASKNEDRKLPMASTTKIMTAITVIENCDDLDRTITVPDVAVGVEGSSIYLQKGEKISIRDLLYGLMLRSGNDCAVALAVTVGESVENFAAMMNSLAAQIGAKNTHFVNPHGLHDDAHYTTASDLARISAYAMHNPSFREIVGTVTHKTSGENKRVMTNKNKILSKVEGGCGIKTGYTKRAGRCLVSAAKRGESTIICVVLNCGPMFEECARLMNYAFDSLIMSDIISANVPLRQVKVAGGRQKAVNVGLASAIRYPLTSAELGRIEVKYDLPKSVDAPVKKGERIGKVHIYLDNRLLFSEDLFTMESIEKNSIREHNARKDGYNNAYKQIFGGMWTGQSTQV